MRSTCISKIAYLQRRDIRQISCLSYRGISHLQGLVPAAHARQSRQQNDNNADLSNIRQCTAPISTRVFSSSSDGSRPDPFARRPNAKCDPYGQGGKPLPLSEAKALLMTLDPQWKIEENDEDNNNTNGPPQALIREFIHADFIAGSKFISKIAAVAQLNIHFPSLKLERRIIPNQKAWQVVSRIRCHTLVLGGLSTHDFHLAMLIDVEAARPEVKELLSPDGSSE